MGISTKSLRFPEYRIQDANFIITIKGYFHENFRDLAGRKIDFVESLKDLIGQKITKIQQIVAFILTES